MEHDVDLEDTALAELCLLPFRVERSDDDWLHVEVKNHVFRCRGGPMNLSEMVAAFANLVQGRPLSAGS